MSIPSAIVECDLDDDGTFETDISAHVRDIAIGFGRNSILEKHRPRTLDGLVLDNEDSRFSPDNASSPYNQSGKTWKQDQRIRVKVLVPTAAVTNINENPSLETDADGWASGFGSVSRVTTQARYGKACLEHEGTAGGDYVQVRRRDGYRFSISGSTSYVWRAWVRVTGGASTWTARISWFTIGDIWLSDSDGEVVVLAQDGPWTEIAVVATSPPTAAKAYTPIVETGGSFGVGEFIYVDGGYFYEGADVTLPYCDGDVPGSTWSGTAHESTSSRPADPTFEKFAGRITSINLKRGLGDDPVNRCTVSAVSDLDRFLDRRFSIGNIIQQPGDVVLNAIFDLLEPHLAVTGGFWGILGGGFAYVEDRRDADAALEGDFQTVFVKPTPPLDGQGAYLDLSSEMGAGETWKVTLHVGNPTDWGGNDVLVKLQDSGGVLASQVVTLPSGITEHEYVSFTVTWTPGGSARRIYILADEDFTGGSETDYYAWDLLQFTQDKNVIRRDLRLAFGETEYAELEHVAAFQRSARALINDVVNSIGGVIWEKGDGTIVIEDYKVRLDSPIPVIRFTDAADELDGAGMPPTALSLDEDRTYSEVTAISDGDLTGPDTGIREPVWSLEPAGIVLGAYEERTLFARYLADESGPLIVERPRLVALVSAGALMGAYTYVDNMGVGGFIVLRADSAGATIDGLHVILYGAPNFGAVRQRGSSRSRVSKGDDSGRQLEIDMPCQAENTTAMNEVAQQILDLLIGGRQTMILPFQAGSTLEWLYAAGLEVSVPIWIRHNTGPGNFALDEGYYLEGGSLSMKTGAPLELTLYADKAA